MKTLAQTDQERAKKRGPAHLWKPGQSGNPSGRPRHVLPDGRSVREAARAATPEALELLLTALRDTKQPMPLRVGAAQAILRTGHADALRDAPGLSDVTVLVQQIVAPALPVPGVLNSPVREHIALPVARGVAGVGEVIDVGGVAQ